MTDATVVPTLAAWLGGRERLGVLIARFYEKVPLDPVLAPVFAGMDPHHAAHVADFVAECSAVELPTALKAAAMLT
ncbi:MAG: hypothetical protein ABI963_11200 [Rhizomicrobium sp.]